jgi:type II secretory pathway pseudopilin PulG
MKARVTFPKCQKGTSLIEVMIATGILSLIISTMMFLVSFVADEQSRALNLTVQEELIQSVAVDLRADSSIYQKNFAPAATSNATILADANLPFKWNGDVVCDKVIKADCCDQCQGLMGYTIRPINGNPGLFMTTVRLSHPNLTSGEIWYEFIVVPK